MWLSWSTSGPSSLLGIQGWAPKASPCAACSPSAECSIVTGVVVVFIRSESDLRSMQGSHKDTYWGYAAPAAFGSSVYV